MSPNAGPAARFALELRALREQAGSLPYWKMARRCRVSKSALAEAAAGRQIPSERVLDAYVSVCGGDLNWWRARRVRAIEELEAAARPGTSLLPAGDRSLVADTLGTAVAHEAEDPADLPDLPDPAVPAGSAAVGGAADDVIDADIVEDSVLRRMRASVAGHASVYLAGLALLVAIGTGVVVVVTRPASDAAVAGPRTSSAAPVQPPAGGGGTPTAPLSARPSASPSPSVSGSPVLPPLTAPADGAATPPQKPATRAGRAPDRHSGATPGETGGTSHVYAVTGADSKGLAIQTEPHVDHVLHYVPNGTSLHVVCQTNHGDWVAEDDRWQYGRHFTTWDRLTDGTWVYDWYMTTPRVEQSGYSPGISPCPGG
ncbi:helix-turn-helix transcriptional regulator [Actinoallomurus spadix]|uniref:helix-turn-helix domain-containing protein n=1 Tax=Actinoallomurus spadix TaxID=79912 RepID=UPI0020927A82|nr:helix-turn-helix transcriptional regulator [Actinoallomurus spadix]MCO5991709.1 helix-turn-helix transcriptional regulator [Actinoallomurus spadix]